MRDPEGGRPLNGPAVKVLAGSTRTDVLQVGEVMVQQIEELCAELGVAMNPRRRALLRTPVITGALHALAERVPVAPLVGEAVVMFVQSRGEARGGAPARTVAADTELAELVEVGDADRRGGDSGSAAGSGSAGGGGVGDGEQGRPDRSGEGVEQGSELDAGAAQP